jgi:hypothetical protein
MNTRLLMMASAVLMGLMGIVLSFLPQEILIALGQEPKPVVTVALQLMGAPYFGFAMTNWMAKGTTVGGIYGRPISIGNFTHFVVGGLALIKSYTGIEAYHHYILILAIVYLAFGILFGYIMLTHPKSPTK